MPIHRNLLNLCVAVSLLGSWLLAQQPISQTATAIVPRLVNYSGKAVDEQGKALSGVAGATFAIYKDQEGGAALWMETQNITADKAGHYTVQLGASKSEGLPMELFSTGEARWLGVRINGGEEQARTLLLSVPYALKAADAETLGGKPASAFLQAATAAASPGSAKPGQAGVNPDLGGSGTTNYLARWKSSTKLGNSAVYQSGGNIGIGTTTPASKLDVNGASTLRGNTTVSGNLSSTGKVSGASLDVSGASTLRGGASVTGNLSSTGNVSAGGNLSTSGNLGVTGSITANQGISAGGNLSASGSISANGTVSGSNMAATSSGAVAMRGENHGSGGGSDGVDGIAHGPASGVAGINDSTSGVGVWGQSPGWSFYSAGNTAQDRSAGGWAKAMVTVNGEFPPYSIQSCFNSFLSGAAATTPPCGFNLTEQQFGVFYVDFGFEVGDRFVASSLVGLGDPAATLQIFPQNNYVETLTLDRGGDLVGGVFQLIVY